VAGCNGSPHCKGCHNPESWDFNRGDKVDGTFLSSMQNKIKSFDELIENIMIFGGEPLDQDINEMSNFLEWLHQFSKKVWIFTRYDFENVPQIIKEHCDYLKCGRYEENLATNGNIQHGIKLATSNQRIYKKGIDY
jgi:anaerobic ribonucleoside-triphosphate reductase activating protein